MIERQDYIKKKRREGQLATTSSLLRKGKKKDSAGFRQQRNRESGELDLTTRERHLGLGPLKLKVLELETFGTCRHGSRPQIP
jgi:hypothetical protein